MLKTLGVRGRSIFGAPSGRVVIVNVNLPLGKTCVRWITLGIMYNNNNNNNNNNNCTTKYKQPSVTLPCPSYIFGLTRATFREGCKHMNIITAYYVRWAG